VSRVIGIDLGTTNSCVAIMEGGGPVVIPNGEGSRTTPTIVAFTETGERLVGQTAKRQAVTNPDSTVSSVKRLIGRRFDSEEVRRTASLVPYRIVPAPNGDAWVEVRGRAYSPAEVQAVVLRSLRQTAEEYLGEPVTDAVITVPAYFDDSQRQATKDAGTIAGLAVLRIVNEPTAAALAYGLGGGHRRTVAVYDLGGGTFDVSVLEIGDGVYEVRATSGDTFLGGEDFDQRLVDFYAAQFEREEGIDLTRDRVALQRLKEAVERAKHELSVRVETTISLPFLVHDDRGPRHLQAVLTRARLEELVRDLVERTIRPCEIALERAGIGPAQVEEVILVGGQTRMPLVQQVVRDFFRRDPHRGVNPDEVVAVGAAVQSGILRGDVRDVLLLDVTPLALGIETKGGVFTRLIEPNTTIPYRRGRAFSTASDNQPSVTVHVLQGDREMAGDNKSLGQFELLGIPPAPRGVPKIEVTFDIDANGIVNVSAKDLGTGREQAIRITASGGLTAEEIRVMREDAERHGAEDARRREFAELRNEAESLLYSTERAQAEYRAVLEEEEARLLAAALTRVRAVLDAGEVRPLREAVQALTAAASVLSRLIYRDAADPFAGDPGRSRAGGGDAPPLR
jgi:molecular chaperone DnaK